MASRAFPGVTTMAPAAAYDEIAEWYEREFLPHQRRGSDEQEFADGIGVDEAIVRLLGPGPGPGDGRCLDLGCGTGIYAHRVRSLGWTPVGVDLSAGMLAHATGRLPVARADVSTLPVASGSLDAVIGVMVHSDLAGFGAVVDEVARVLRPGGRFVHIGVHPCFIGDFADRSDPTRVVVGPGYLDEGWTPPVGATAGELGRSGQVRDKVGAAHYTLSTLLNTIVGAGLRIDRATEGFAPTPITLSLRALR